MRKRSGLPLLPRRSDDAFDPAEYESMDGRGLEWLSIDRRAVPAISSDPGMHPERAVWASSPFFFGSSSISDGVLVLGWFFFFPPVYIFCIFFCFEARLAMAFLGKREVNQRSSI